MGTINKLILFLTKLEEDKIFFKLDKIRDSILIEVSVPGQKWEIEFMADGTIEIEKYISEGKIFDEKEIEVLFRDFSD